MNHSSEILTKHYLINGPVNVVRLEKDNRILYIFGDIHKELHEQNVCDPIGTDKEAIDLDKLLIKVIKQNPNVKFNLYLEVDDMKMVDSTLNYSSMYIEQIRKLGKYKFSNFKSQVVDNRYKILNKNDYLLNSLYDDNNLPTYYYPINFNIIRAVLNFLTQHELIINMILKKISSKPIYQKHAVAIEDVATFLKSLVSKISKIVDKMKSNMISHTEGQMITMELCSACFNIKLMLQLTFASVQDSNMINTLEKQKESVNYYYCGLYHMVNTTHVLVNEFGYKITHLLYGNKDEIEPQLKKLKVDYSLETTNTVRHLFDINKTVIQCINLESFPDNLL